MTSLIAKQYLNDIWHSLKFLKEVFNKIHLNIFHLITFQINYFMRDEKVLIAYTE